VDEGGKGKGLLPEEIDHVFRTSFFKKTLTKPVLSPSSHNTVFWMHSARATPPECDYWQIGS
jgi:hypothetical protein